MTTTDNLGEQIAQAFDNAFEPSGIPNVDASRRHSAHKYSAQCYVCDGDITKLADTAASVVIPTLNAQRAEIERLARDLATVQELAAKSTQEAIAADLREEGEKLRAHIAELYDCLEIPKNTDPKAAVYQAGGLHDAYEGLGQLWEDAVKAAETAGITDDTAAVPEDVIKVLHRQRDEARTEVEQMQARHLELHHRIGELGSHTQELQGRIDKALELLNRGYPVDAYLALSEPAADTTPDKGVPAVEPVATTLQRVINDLLDVAVFHAPEGIADPNEISHDDLVAAKALREYADRIAKHPALNPTTEES